MHLLSTSLLFGGGGEEEEEDSIKAVSSSSSPEEVEEDAGHQSPVAYGGDDEKPSELVGGMRFPSGFSARGGGRALHFLIREKGRQKERKVLHETQKCF